MSTKKKVDLKKAAKASNTVAEMEPQITEAMLVEYCPKDLVKRLKAAKTPAARADLLYEIEHNELKKARDAYNAVDKFTKKLEAWFIQEFHDDQRGVTGKLARVEIKSKTIGRVPAESWPIFYKYIQRKGEFDLLNKALNQKAISARWEVKKEIPGVVPYPVKSVSLTKAKGTK